MDSFAHRHEMVMSKRLPHRIRPVGSMGWDALSVEQDHPQPIIRCPNMTYIQHQDRDVLQFKQSRRSIPPKILLPCLPTPPLPPPLPQFSPRTLNQHHHLMPATMTKSPLHSSPLRKKKRRRRKSHTWSIGSQTTRPIPSIGRRPTRAG